LTLIAITTGFMSWFYDFGWFTGSILGGLIYYLLNRKNIGMNAEIVGSD
jgi:NCS1 family nucleobase:cation symporter-1